MRYFSLAFLALALCVASADAQYHNRNAFRAQIVTPFVPLRTVYAQPIVAAPLVQQVVQQPVCDVPAQAIVSQAYAAPAVAPFVAGYQRQAFVSNFGYAGLGFSSRFIGHNFSRFSRPAFVVRPAFRRF